MRFALKEISLNVLNMWTRIPFRYGITTLTALPHLFVRVEMEVNGKRAVGLAADGLAPKWFTKVPEAPVEGEIADMLEVIRAAGGQALSIGGGTTVFSFWKEMYDRQKEWGRARGYPGLLWNFGVSLIERAMIDGICRSCGTTFKDAVQENVLGIELGAVHERLAGLNPGMFLRPPGANRISVRQTVGLSDPLTEDEIAPSDRVQDGLPQSLAAAIAAYGLKRFKIKLPAEIGAATERLQRLRHVIDGACVGYQFSLDGNEFFHDATEFRAYWERLIGQKEIAEFFGRGLLFVEQPLHREIALSASVQKVFADWPERPVIVIDESDGELESLPRALECGYSGTSHKNCKGVFKGIANACLIAQDRAQGREVILTGEDLANVGPVALMQDLAVAWVLGLQDVERNGHHYFAGLSAFPRDIQERVGRAHPDLYRWHEGASSFATVRIEDGMLALDSVVDAPFGYAMEMDTRRFVPADVWHYESLSIKGGDQ